MRAFDWRRKHQAESLRDVLDVNDRPPRRAIAHDPNLARRVGPAHEVVEDHVGTQSGRGSVGGRVAHVHRAEVGGRQCVKVFLGAHLRDRVGRQGLQLSVLVEQVVTGCGSVHAAGGRVKKTPRSRLLRQSCETHRSLVVDLISPGLVEVSKRVVAERGQMNDRVESGEIPTLDVTDVLPDGRDLGLRSLERAVAIQKAVEPGHLVTPLDQVSRHDRPDVAVVARQENLQGRLTRSSRVLRRISRGFRATEGPAACPCIARTGRACRPRAGGRSPGG